jgi:serine/threonine protein kinase
MENIVINERDEANLIDFGFAIELEEDETSTTQCGTYLG